MYQKDWAIRVDAAQEQALELKRNYRDQLVPHIAQEFPSLFDYVMNGQPVGTSFIAVLGARYKQSAPTLNLGVVSNEISEKYRDHLVWARDPQRYEIFICGIRARLTAQILTDERTNRYLIGAQNRKMKAEQALVALEQLAWQREDRQRAIPQESVCQIDAHQKPLVVNQVIVPTNQSANDASSTVTILPKENSA